MNAALLRAAASGDLAEVQRILNDNPGIEVDAVNDYGNTPLVIAVRLSHKAIVEVLLAHGAAVNGPVGIFMTPLQEACNEDLVNEDIIKLLLEQGAGVDAITVDDRQTPLTRACRWRTNLGIVQLLINSGADVNGGGGEHAPLHCAAWSGNIKAIELLIQAGADVNRVSTGVSAGSTPLHYAASRNQLTSLNTLLAAGADPNISDTHGRTPLYRAALWSSVEIVNALLDAGCDPLHRDNQGRTPLQELYDRRHNEEEPFSAEEFNIITALVAAGDRSWECVPTPCLGLEAAMVSVWQAAPDEMPELMKRIQNPPQTLIELYARMNDDEEMKKVVQEVLRVLHHHFPCFPHLKEHLLNCIFGVATF